MGSRPEILGDVGGSSPDSWDRIWDYRPAARRQGARVGLRSASAPILTARRCRPAEWTEWLAG